MLKVSLLFLIAFSIMSTSVFAESTIQVDISEKNITSLDSVLITGKITDVSNYKPVKLLVTAPDGSIVYSPMVALADDGTFRKLLQPTLPSFQTGTYTVIVSHEDTQITSQIEFTVTSQEMPRNQSVQPIIEKPAMGEKLVDTGKISMSADAINGSDVITITGNTDLRNSDITLIVNSPGGNIVTIAQITPGINGDFEAEVKTGGQMWKEDGVYTITANQGAASEHKKSIQVEIEDGLVVPEFGIIVSLILLVSIISIIVATKSKLAILPRY
ncbi:PEFG-CTERM sorting domain-containing protein [Nitrosopumilus sp.]|uniref:PEFG-CTERM sorting domain-containing protein n=1 Tax=Nitrosopumilus sp. TaxID=2024843 RepID=UPI00349FF29D